jgi:hypothetical protein
MTARVECSTCKGLGVTIAFVDYGLPREHESGLYSIPCPSCDGMGSRTTAEHILHLRLRAEGARLRAHRVAVGISLRALSNRLGVSATEFSSWERGKAEMSTACRAWLTAGGAL